MVKSQGTVRRGSIVRMFQDLISGEKLSERRSGGFRRKRKKKMRGPQEK